MAQHALAAAGEEPDSLDRLHQEMILKIGQD